MYGMWVLALMDHLSLALLTSLLRFAKHHLPVWRIGLKKWVITNTSPPPPRMCFSNQRKKNWQSRAQTQGQITRRKVLACHSSFWSSFLQGVREDSWILFERSASKNASRKKKKKKEIYCKTHHPPLKMLWELCLLGLGSDPHDPLQQQQQEEEVMNFLCPTKAPTSSCLSPPLPFGRSSSTSSSTNKILCSILIQSFFRELDGRWDWSAPPFPPTPSSSQNLWRHGNYSA